MKPKPILELIEDYLATDHRLDAAAHRAAVLELHERLIRERKLTAAEAKPLRLLSMALKAAKKHTPNVVTGKLPGECWALLDGVRIAIEARAPGLDYETQKGQVAMAAFKAIASRKGDQKLAEGDETSLRDVKKHVTPDINLNNKVAQHLAPKGNLCRDGLFTRRGRNGVILTAQGAHEGNKQMQQQQRAAAQ